MLESLDQVIRTLRAQYWSARDPEGRGFAPLAEAYRLHGELGEAASLVQDGLERLPEFVAGYIVASRIARDRGDLLGSQTFLTRALELDPENVVARFERATLTLEEGDREGAISDLRIVLDLDPAHREATYHLDEIESGSAWNLPTADVADMADVADVAEAFDVVDETEAGVEPGQAPPIADDVLDVLPQLSVSAPPRETSEVEPERSLLTRTMGDLYAAQGFLDRAIEVYRHLSARDPGDETLRSRLAVLLERAGSSLTEAEDLDLPENPSTSNLPVERTIRDYFEDLLAWVPGAVPIAALAPDSVPELLSPIPVASLAPDSGDAGAVFIADVLYAELGDPIPVELLAPDSASDSPSHDGDGGIDPWLEDLKL